MRALFIVLICLVFPSLTQAQEVEKWGEAGSWEILIDNTTGGSCFIEAEFEDGSLVRIGLDIEKESGFVAVYNRAWGEIEGASTYDVGFSLDGERYTGEGTGVYLGDLPGIDILFDSTDFFWDIMRKNVMRLYDEDEEVTAFSLEGTYSGLEGVLACQDDIG